MKAFLMPFLFASLHAASHAAPRETVSIEVDESQDRFRVLVRTDRSITFDAFQTRSPASGFPAAFASVLAMNAQGEVVGCHQGNEPSHPADSISGSRWPKDARIVRVDKDHPYASEWFSSQSLFFSFDNCVLPERRGGYAKYQIQIEIETSRGVISTKTDWLDFHGFKTL